MKLDRHTYEAWLLDRAEGNLSPEQERLLDAFLQAHPDLAVAQEPLPRIAAGTEPFPGKESLLHAFPPSGAPTAARLNDFLAARLEGDLSPEQEQQLDQYLYEHPEAAKDAAAMASAKVIAARAAYGAKARLERHFPPGGLPDAQRLGDFLIADAEGDLTGEQRAALRLYVHEHPAAQREQRLVLASRIQPAPLRFPWKQELKKREARVLPLWTRWAAAASIALLTSMGWWALRNDPQPVAGSVHVASHAAPPAAPAYTATALAQTPRQPEPIASTAHPTTQRAAAARNRTVQQASASASNKPGPGMPPNEAPMPDPALPDPAPAPGKAATLLAHASPREHAAPQPQDGSGEKAETAAAAASGGQDIGVYMANKLRGDVLESPQRPTGLDVHDMVALADRAIAAVSSGHGGVQVQRSATRERIRLSLGRNFSISASRAR